MNLRPALFAMCILLGACERGARHSLPTAHGSPERGLAVLKRHECNVCHEIPGVRGLYGRVGPSLADYRRNVYIAGKYPNTPEYLVPWMMNTPALAPLTAMPAMDLTLSEARDIAAYLYTLE